MTNHIVCIEGLTYYSVDSDSEEDAINLVIEGQGKQVNREIIDAYIPNSIDIEG